MVVDRESTVDDPVGAPDKESTAVDRVDDPVGPRDSAMVNSVGENIGENDGPTVDCSDVSSNDMDILSSTIMDQVPSSLDEASSSFPADVGALVESTSNITISSCEAIAVG